MLLVDGGTGEEVDFGKGQVWSKKSKGARRGKSSDFPSIGVGLNKYKTSTSGIR